MSHVLRLHSTGGRLSLLVGHAVAPGPVDTAMAKAVHTADIRADYHDAIPLNRYGLEEELAEAIFFLSCERSSYITGQILAVDGGFDAAGIGLPTLRGARRNGARKSNTPALDAMIQVTIRRESPVDRSRPHVALAKAAIQPINSTSPAWAPAAAGRPATAAATLPAAEGHGPTRSRTRR